MRFEEDEQDKEERQDKCVRVCVDGVCCVCVCTRVRACMCTCMRACVCVCARAPAPVSVFSRNTVSKKHTEKSEEVKTKHLPFCART